MVNNSCIYRNTGYYKISPVELFFLLICFIAIGGPTVFQWHLYCKTRRQKASEDLEKFLNRLEDLLKTKGCNGQDLTNAEIILKEMHIPKDERVEFLEDCRNSGGFCDCEIFLNSEDYLREKYNS